MNTNQTNPLVVRHYDNTYQVCVDLGVYARANAPDQKSRNKVRKVVSSHSDLPFARALLYALRGAFDRLHDRSWDKAVDNNNADAYAKHIARAEFYRRIADWAKACYDVEKEAPVITTNVDVPEKDAEDDSDPYIKPSPKADPMEDALTQLKTRLTLADFGKRRIDSATCFWDAFVQISDDLRGDLAADQIKKASTITVPDMMWEVTDDPNRALYRTEKDAMRATRELFPDEFVTLRYARLRRRNVKTFK